MTRECPYCEQDYRTKGGLYEHVLSKHSETVLALWVEEHGVTPRMRGQRSLREAVA